MTYADKISEIKCNVDLPSRSGQQDYFQANTAVDWACESCMLFPKSEVRPRFICIQTSARLLYLSDLKVDAISVRLAVPVPTPYSFIMAASLRRRLNLISDSSLVF